MEKPKGNRPFKDFKTASSHYRWKIIDPIYSIVKKPKLLIPQKELKNKWLEHIANSSPLTVSYLFDYYTHSFEEFCGSESLFSKSNYDNEKGTPDVPSVDDYLDLIVEEQRYLYAYEIRRLTLEVFNRYSDFFTQRIGQYCYQVSLNVEIPIEGSNQNVIWLATNTIEPINFNSNGELVQYFGRLQLITSDIILPYHSKLVFKYSPDIPEKDRAFVDDINRNIIEPFKGECGTIIGIANDVKKHFNSYINGTPTTKIIESFKGLTDHKIKQDRYRTNQKLIKHFPRLMSTYRTPDIKRRKDGEIIKTSCSHAMINGRNLKIMGFLNDEED